MRATKPFVAQVLAREELLPNKNLGQNFCVDEAVLEHIPCAAGEITVGVYVRCQGGGWGTFDDFLLNPEK